MPSAPNNRHLKFIDINDFKAGAFEELATASRAVLVPSGAASKMLNCYAIPTGGLRAFFKPTAFTTTGLAAHTHEVALGIFQRNGIPNRSGSGDGSDSYLATFDSVDSKIRTYRRDGTANATTWSAIRTSLAKPQLGSRAQQFSLYRTTLGTFVVMVERGNQTDDGVYSIFYDDGTVAKKLSYTGPLTISQARLIVGGGNDNTLHWTDIGGFTEKGSLDVAPNQNLANLSMLTTFEPDAILVAKEGAPWVEIAGDITDSTTPVRELGTGHFGRFTEQVPARLSDGRVAFIEPYGYIWGTDGRTFTNLSPGLRRFDKVTDNESADAIDVVSPGQMAQVGNWLFGPKGWVFDIETNTWFQITDTDGTTIFDSAYWHGDTGSGVALGVERGTGFNIITVPVFDGGSIEATHNTTYQWVSAQLADPEGRRVCIREVDVFTQGYGTSGGTCAVSLLDVDGSVLVTKTLTCDPKAGEMRFPFPQSAQRKYQAVKIVMTGNGSDEAPSIDRIRLGFLPAHSA